MTEETAIRVRGLRTQFGAQVVHQDLDLDVRRGEILGVVGGSGTGKSVLLRSIIGLNRPAAGRIEVLGRSVQEEWNGGGDLDRHWGVLFQEGALFSALTVSENVQAPLREHFNLPDGFLREVAALKVAMVGLPPNAGAKFPSELSGGMKKRAGLARALALDPPLLFLDEPTAGLDPISAAQFDSLLGQLKATLDLTVFLVTHDLDTLYTICDRVAVLAEGRVIAVAPVHELERNPHPWIQEYFQGPRGRAAAEAELRRASGGETWKQRQTTP